MPLLWMFNEFKGYWCSSHKMFTLKVEKASYNKQQGNFEIALERSRMNCYTSNVNVL
jgi:hypothetical protein